jgi:hypothetical protein
VETWSPAKCPACRGAPDPVPIPIAIERYAVSAARLEEAIRSGRLSVWKTQGGEPAVCPGCVERVKDGTL